MVKLPPASMFLAAPKMLLGLCSEAGSKPPDSVRPLVGLQGYKHVLNVIESIKMITSSPISTNLLARSNNNSATLT